MSFADPLVLLALLALPLLVKWYTSEQRRRTRAASAFVAPALTQSVTPSRPRWRRHAPMLVLLIALAVLIFAAARPQRSVAKPVTDGAIVLANDVSSSMQATDVAPTRLRAAERAARQFLAGVPGTVQVGVLAFARTPAVLQSPTTNHVQTANALAHLPQTRGGTAVGLALQAALHELGNVPRVAGKRPPGAIVLISDGASNVGPGPIAVARQAASKHIPIFTVSIGTPKGTIQIKKGVTASSPTVTAPVPVSGEQLAQIAAVSKGKAFKASDAAGVNEAYAHLAAHLGHKQVKQEITTSFAGVALALLVLGGALSLRWFGRLV
ncbi:MAG TPA: VWA domain-containing protein [Solirubrobacteraceae bacterium]|jgi:Ca-activated chloride channel family protein